MFPHTHHLRGAPSVWRATVVVFVAMALAMPASAQLERAMSDSLTDREFWHFFSSMSEDGGAFVSENFVSNEQTYQHVIPTLKRTIAPGGVYLGVGPEQNFTYIANLRPKMAVIFDIRRQNAMAHLMYKALFELSPTRADFVSRLFSRPLPKSLSPHATPVEIFTALTGVRENDSAFTENRKAVFDQLRVKHGFELTPDDVRSITHVYLAFFEAGPDISYAYRPGTVSTFRPAFATYSQIQSLTNATGEHMAFLESEENYRWLRGRQLKNMVVPVVGDFAGPKAIRAVGEYVKQRGGIVSTFYLSNVEQYLFRSADDAARFYRNVAMLPIDSTSTFIRSIPPGDGLFGGFITSLGGPVANSSYFSVTSVDSAGVRIVYATTDSAGQRITRRSVDSTSRGQPRSLLEIFRTMRARGDSVARGRDSVGGAIIIGRDRMPSLLGSGAVMAGGPALLRSGIAPIRASLDAFAVGRLATYRDLIAMTKIDGWE